MPATLILLLKGHPGTGKSALAAALAAALPGAAALDKDDARPWPPPPGATPAALNDAAYVGTAARVRALVEGGAAPPRAIIIDSPLSSRVRWDALVAAAGPGAVAVLVEVTCSDAALWRARVEARERRRRAFGVPANVSAHSSPIFSSSCSEAWLAGVHCSPMGGSIP